MGAGNFLEVQRILCPICPKTFYATDFFPAIFLHLLVHYIFLYHVAIDLNTENLVGQHEIWYSIAQLKKYNRLCKNIVRSQLTQYSEHLPHSSKVFNSHSSCWCQQETTYLTEDIYAAYCMAKYVHPNTVPKIKNTDFLYLPAMESTNMYDKGVRKGVVLGLNTPLSLIFCKNFIIRRVYRTWFFTKIRRLCAEEYAYYVNKLRLKTWLWRQIVTSQTTHLKCKWPPSATEWNPPMKIFCVRHWRMKQVPHSILDSHRVQLIKHVNAMLFCPNFQVSQLLISSHILKHEVTGNNLLIICIFDLLSMT